MLSACRVLKNPYSHEQLHRGFPFRKWYADHQFFCLLNAPVQWMDLYSAFFDQTVTFILEYIMFTPALLNLCSSWAALHRYNLDCYKFWLMSTYKYRTIPFCLNQIFPVSWAVYTMTIGLRERDQILALIAEVLKALLRGATLWSVITLSKISKIGATRCKILRLKCRKFDFCWAAQLDAF